MIGGTVKRQMLSKLLESPAVDKMTFALAAAENELLKTAVSLEEAMDLNHLRGQDLPTVEDRKEGLKALLGALAQADMETVFVEDVAPSLLDDTEGVEQYLAMDSADWEAQIERWANSYRDAAPDMTDRELAAHHVQSKWGVDLATFEGRVVEFDPGTEAERLFAGNLRAVGETMERAREQAEGE